jgi:hypothetical protein
MNYRYLYILLILGMSSSVLCASVQSQGTGVLDQEMDSTFAELTAQEEDLSPYRYNVKWWHYGHKPAYGQKISEEKARHIQQKQRAWREKHMQRQMKAAQIKAAQKKKREDTRLRKQRS